MLYPLFGIGANVAQALAGRFLKHLPTLIPAADSSALAVGAAWDHQLRILMLTVCSVGAASLLVHAHICRLAKVESWGEPERESKPIEAENTSSSGKKVMQRDSFRALSESPQLRCLAIMALAQGLSTNVFQARVIYNIFFTLITFFHFLCLRFLQFIVMSTI